MKDDIFLTQTCTNLFSTEIKPKSPLTYLSTIHVILNIGTLSVDLQYQAETKNFYLLIYQLFVNLF